MNRDYLTPEQYDAIQRRKRDARYALYVRDLRAISRVIRTVVTAGRRWFRRKGGTA